MPSFLWQGNLPNRASKIKRLLACHDIHLPWANVKFEMVWKFSKKGGAGVSDGKWRFIWRQLIVG
jgi:hypothetical protein